MSRLEETLALQIRAAKLPRPEREFRFRPSRRWRFDFCWPVQRVACEVEGGVWSGGRHTRGRGFEHDAAKYNAATLEGWRVLRVTAGMIRSGEALTTLEQALVTPKAGKTVA